MRLGNRLIAACAVAALAVSAALVGASSAHADTTPAPLGLGRVTTLAGGSTGSDPFGGSVSGSTYLNGGVFVGAGTAVERVDATTGAVTVLAGSVGNSGCELNQSGALARFIRPTVIGNDGTFVYVLDANCRDIRRINAVTGATSRAAYAGYESNAVVSGHYLVAPSDFSTTVVVQNLVTGQSRTLTIAGGYSGRGLALDGSTLWVFSDYAVTTIDLQTDLQTEHVVVGNFPYLPGVVPLAGYLYVPADGRIIRAHVSDDTYLPVAGSGSSGHADGVGAEAWFGGIAGLSTDGTNIYAADSSNYGAWVRKISPATDGDTVAPSAPTGLKVLSATPTSARLSWTASTDNVGVTGYDVYAGNTRITGTSASTTVTVTGLTATAQYSFAVKAHDAAGNASAASAPVTVTPGTFTDTTPPSAPAGLRVLASSGTSVRLGWAAATDNVAVTGYDIYSGSTRLTGTSTSTTVTVTGLTTGTRYALSVRAHDAAGNASLASDSVTAVPGTILDTVAPTAPTALKVLSTTATSVRLSWSPSTDNIAVTGYNVYAGASKVTGTAGSTTVTVPGLTPGASLTFSVQARDAVGNVSAATAPLTVTLPPSV